MSRASESLLGLQNAQIALDERATHHAEAGQPRRIRYFWVLVIVLLVQVLGKYMIIRYLDP